MSGVSRWWPRHLRRDPYFANPSDALPNNALAYQRSLPTREASFVRQSNRLSIDQAVMIS
jgi:hypothetical protein